MSDVIVNPSLHTSSFSGLIKIFYYIKKYISVFKLKIHTGIYSRHPLSKDLFIELISFPDIPKSHTFILPSVLMRTFDGFMSRCIYCLLFMNFKAFKIAPAIFERNASGITEWLI